MHNPFISKSFLRPLLAGCALFFSGCYTQLYTRGYAERAMYRPAAPQDTAIAGDSAALAKRGEGDTLLPEEGKPQETVIVNNYYGDPYYRGYAYSEWEYPIISLGFYSSRYRSYHNPYWWDDPWYHRSYHRPHHRGGGYHGGYSSGGGGGSGPARDPNYKSDRRIFSPAPQYPAPSKGRRSEPARESVPVPEYVPAQKASSESSGSNYTPAPRTDSNSGNSSSGSSGSSSSSESKKSKEYPTLKKGRRG